MLHQPFHTTTATRHRTPADAADLDTFLLDDDFDDALDCQIADLRESLADDSSYF